MPFDFIFSIILITSPASNCGSVEGKRDVSSEGSTPLALGLLASTSMQNAITFM